MTFDEMVHVIRAAADVAGVDELFVFGSQAIHLALSRTPPELLESMELDVAVLSQPDRTDRVDGVLGEDSLFHSTHGYYAHGVNLELRNFRLVGNNGALPPRSQTAGCA